MFHSCFIVHNGYISESFLNLFYPYSFFCFQTGPLYSVWESVFLHVTSHKIIFLEQIRPSLQLLIFAPTLSINFVYFFSQLCVLVFSLQVTLPFLRSALWWTRWPMLTVIHCAAGQPTVASSLDRLPYIPMTIYRILSWQKGMEVLFSNSPSAEGAGFVADNRVSPVERQISLYRHSVVTS